MVAIAAELKKLLEEQEQKWSPPPHLRSDVDHSPIPASFFRQAAGDKETWDLNDDGYIENNAGEKGS